MKMPVNFHGIFTGGFRMEELKDFSLMSEFMIADPDSLTKSLKDIEFMIRHSREYKAWVAYVYTTFPILESDMLKGVDLTGCENITTDVHHIVTLADITFTVGMQMIDQHDEGVTDFDIAKEVIRLHMDDEVLCVALTRSLHEAAHAKLYDITKDTPCVHIGHAQKFVDEYGYWMDPEILAEYEKFGLNCNKEAEHEATKA
jgi:hypothetical protein